MNGRGFNPVGKGYGPLFQFLDQLTTTVERVAAGQFTREAIAVVKNRQFIEFCERAGDTITLDGRSFLVSGIADVADCVPIAESAQSRTVGTKSDLNYWIRIGLAKTGY